MGAEEGGELPRDPVQQGGAALRLLALQLLDLLPVEEDLLCRVSLHVTEDVGMAAAELLVDPAQDVGDGEEAGLVRHLGVKDDLEGEITELLFQLDRIVLVDGLQDLVGLLQQVRLDAVERLLAVPERLPLRVDDRVLKSCHQLFKTAVIRWVMMSGSPTPSTRFRMPCAR